MVNIVGERLFRKKPVIIRAMPWNQRIGWGHPRVRPFNPTAYPDDSPICSNCGFMWAEHGKIDTLENVGFIVCPGDWIVQGVQGEFYPVKPDIFEATYETVKPEAGDAQP